METRRQLPLLFVATPVAILNGCDVSRMAVTPQVKAVVEAKQFTLYVDGQQKVLTLPEVLSQHNPETRQLRSGMLVQMAGARPIEVEVTEKVAFDTYTVACRLATGQSFDGTAVEQSTLMLKVDTKAGTVEPMDDVARSYFEIEGSRFGG